MCLALLQLRETGGRVPCARQRDSSTEERGQVFGLCDRAEGHSRTKATRTAVQARGVSLGPRCRLTLGFMYRLARRFVEASFKLRTDNRNQPGATWRRWVGKGYPGWELPAGKQEAEGPGLCEALKTPPRSAAREHPEVWERVS